MPSPSHHVKLALYVDYTAVIAKFCQPALLLKYLKYLKHISATWNSG
jgi:hypothetical protein